jgi:hypothetical protein
MTTLHELALAYDRYAAALWRGDEAETRAFAAWLEGYWADEGPAEPAEPADHPYVISVLGGAGVGIRWYARGRTVIGYVGNRHRGCCHVPINATLPPFPLYRPS